MGGGEGGWRVCCLWVDFGKRQSVLEEMAQAGIVKITMN